MAGWFQSSGSENSFDENVSCGGLEAGKSYCVEAWGEPAPTTTTTTTQPPTTITTETMTTTTTTTTITTTAKTESAPGPTQSGQINTRNRWDLVQANDACTLQDTPRLSLAKLIEWNHAIRTQCQNLWVKTYQADPAITSIEGWSTPTTTSTTSTTSMITTSSPPAHHQERHHYSNAYPARHDRQLQQVKSSDTCASIAQAAGISVSQLTAWNSGVGTGCTSLCVTITSTKGTNLAQLYTWNKKLGTGYTGLWAEYCVCVLIVSVSPTTMTKTTTRIMTTTTMTPGNGCVRVPQSCCGRLVRLIPSWTGIILADFLRWNPGISRSACSSLCLGCYVCIAVL
ncbi:hypothetical protein BJX62DRAFT_223582 [Aspergillus germanicus]